MYPGMAKTAREEGFEEIADWFETLAKAWKIYPWSKNSYKIKKNDKR